MEEIVTQPPTTPPPIVTLDLDADEIRRGIELGSWIWHIVHGPTGTKDVAR